MSVAGFCELTLETAVPEALTGAHVHFALRADALEMERIRQRLA